MTETTTTGVPVATNYVPPTNNGIFEVNGGDEDNNGTNNSQSSGAVYEEINTGDGSTVCTGDDATFSANSDDSVQWECPVCFETIGEVDVIGLYQCAHLACYQCFHSQVQYLVRSGLPLDLSCPICRASARAEYTRCRYLGRRRCVTFDGRWYNLYFAPIVD